ncbi:hypothetical protein TRFO_04496 [Tritrichomonas foetus]|uniref:Uncharacterized protein n=1 Tax=Tritrichomonas foetus TaxID=1144522 RepID=A0A1J4KEK1_9EUKA|nr:hypothetical protein TRFO_04496 [Tritrichomonas foetus]|eukprot:OHT09442.1 hypothetical protein TRFO_04496 [Tritrichomonas foetus]
MIHKLQRVQYSMNIQYDMQIIRKSFKGRYKNHQKVTSKNEIEWLFELLAQNKIPMSLYASGFNHEGQLLAASNKKVATEDGIFQCISPPLKMNIDPRSIVSFSIGFSHCAYVTKAGRAYAAGDDEEFQIGTLYRKKYDQATEVKFPGVYDKFVSVQCGMIYTMYMTEKGTLIYCHQNSDDKKPAIHRLETKVVYISGGSDRAVAIDENGDIFIFSADNPNVSPTRVHLNEAVFDVYCGDDFVVAISLSGKLYASGSLNPLIKQSSKDAITKFIEISSMRGNKFARVSANCAHCVAITEDGRVFTAGSNDSGQLGIGVCDESIEFIQIVSIEPNRALSAAAGIDHSLIVTTEGKLLSCGHNDVGQLMLDTISDDVFRPKQTNNISGKVTQAWAGTGTSVVLTDMESLIHRGRQYFLGDDPHEDEVRNLRYEIETLKETIRQLQEENENLKKQLANK